MTAGAKRLLEEALQLPTKERAKLAARLLESLDADDSDEDPTQVARAWEVEIERRVREVDEGKADLVPWDAFRRELEDDEE